MLVRGRRFLGFLFGTFIDGAIGKAGAAISTYVVETLNKQGAMTRVSSYVTEFVNKVQAGLRVSTHALEIADGQPATARTTQYVIEIMYRTVVPPAFPGWSDCPTPDAAVLAGRGDGQDAAYPWGGCPEPDPAVRPGTGDGLTPDDLPFKWGDC